jgi:hypothetical protein
VLTEVGIFLLPQKAKDRILYEISGQDYEKPEIPGARSGKEYQQTVRGAFQIVTPFLAAAPAL